MIRKSIVTFAIGLIATAFTSLLCLALLFVALVEFKHKIRRVAKRLPFMNRGSKHVTPRQL